jgi:DNA-binding MarR family transcriptional regulator
MHSPNLHNPLESLVGYQLRRTSAGLMSELALDLNALGLSPTEASVLLLIAANPRVTQSDIGRSLGIKRANMAPLAAALELRGLLSRERVDGRSHGLVVTAEGAALGARARAAMDAHDSRLLGRLSGAARDGLMVALAALRADESG